MIEKKMNELTPPVLVPSTSVDIESVHRNSRNDSTSNSNVKSAPHDLPAPRLLRSPPRDLVNHILLGLHLIPSATANPIIKLRQHVINASLSQPLKSGDDLEVAWIVFAILTRHAHELAVKNNHMSRRGLGTVPGGEERSVPHRGRRRLVVSSFFFVVADHERDRPFLLFLLLFELLLLLLLST